MQTLLSCLTTQHDWRLLLLASGICFASGWVAVCLFDQARRLHGRRRVAPAAGAALVAGLGAWATHFIGMKAYDPPGEIAYAPGLTIASLLVVLAGQGLGVFVGLGRRDPLFRLSGVTVASISIAAMHFLGMAAIETHGVVSWNLGQAAGAVVAGLLLSLAAAVVMETLRGRWRIPVAGSLAALSVLGLHTTAMSAVTITPLPGLAGPVAAVPESLVFTGAMVSVAALGVIATLIGGLLYWSRSQALGQIREAIDAMPDGLGFFDAADRLVLWNARYAEVNPEVAERLEVGLPFRSILEIGVEGGLYEAAKGREEAWIAERMAARRRLSNSFEQEVAGKRWLRVQDRRTAAGGVVTVVNDITELKDDARALAEAKEAAETANRAKSQFLANMSHEIRTPLNGVIGVAQALARTPLDPQQKEMLDLIQSSSHTLQTLLSDILDLARVESGRMEIQREPFDLDRAVREAAQLYEASAQAKGLRFEVDLAEAARGWVEGDVVRVKQILTNLVSNAVKFTDSGFIALRVGPGPARAGAPTLRFSVEDTGIGFDAAAKDRLFGRFEQADGAITRKFGGSGLGLAICRQLAEMMDGTLDCESAPGGGSTFILTLPHRPLAAPAPTADEADQLGGDILPIMRVLLADDHPTNRKVVELILSQTAVDLTSVENGAEALDAYRNGDFDLVLMDMQMPVMDGLTACREIRLHEMTHALPRCPMVMLTANAMPEHVAAAQSAGADRHLAKPFEAAELLELVTNLALGAPKALAA